MAVFRIEKTRDYTVMSNYHLRDMSLSLKAKGLLSLMLSLPENWDYTMKGLARICKDGIDSISGGIRELEAHGYLVRARVRSANGQLGSIEYTILEQPKTPSPTQEKPIRENPIQVKPMLDAPIQENPAQLNKEESSNYPSKTNLSITEESSPILSSPPAPRERTGQDGMRKRESYRALILENIEYDVLSQNVQLDKDRLDELVELMVDTVCSNREMIRVAGDDYPAEVVRAAREVLPRESGPAIPRDYGREEDLTPHMTRIEDRMEVAMPTFLLGFKCPPVPEGPDRMRLDILGDLACDVLMGESSPLFTRLYSQGLINGTFDSAYDLLPGAAYVFCGGDSNDPEAVQQAVLDEARRVVREGVDPAYVQRLRRASFGASIKSLNSFEAIASTVSEGCFQGYDPFRFPEVYDSITQQDLLDFIRDNIRPERMALSVIYPKE